MLARYRLEWIASNSACQNDAGKVVVKRERQSKPRSETKEA